MEPRSLKVGEVARATGVSIRTLHHYDEIGLLSPGARSDGGHREYGAADLERLQRILSLRALGLTLAEIGAALERPDGALAPVLERHAARARERAEEQRALAERLDGLLRMARRGGEVTAETLLETLALSARVAGHFTDEQRAELDERARTLGPEAIRRAERDWEVLIAEVRAAMDAGTDPSDPSVAPLVARWDALVEAFTGGNTQIAASVGRMYAAEPGARRAFGLDAAMMDYVSRARGSA